MLSNGKIINFFGFLRLSNIYNYKHHYYFKIKFFISFSESAFYLVKISIKSNFAFQLFAYFLNIL